MRLVQLSRAVSEPLVKETPFLPHVSQGKGNVREQHFQNASQMQSALKPNPSACK